MYAFFSIPGIGTAQYIASAYPRPIVHGEEPCPGKGVVSKSRYPCRKYNQDLDQRRSKKNLTVKWPITVEHGVNKKKTVLYRA